MAKLTKVYFVHDDGSITYLEGEDLEKWERAANGAAALQWAHGGKSGFEGIEHKPLKKPVELKPK